uniref:DNA mismatch repair protein S5 domain-containing protein n=1 Tax=Ciona savignyi TaxID=51511 RepID=H2ZDT5_CIOSA
IKRLDETVVNRIAAGEVIQRPANAVKEMIENCLDAGSTCITVSLKSGGLKLLQISDNGHGIRKEDMEIVCERFTTSKLKEFDDLKSIATFGFRGEALASISHVAHLTITTRTKDSKCAYKASYLDSEFIHRVYCKLKGAVRPTAGNIGTQITVEDLFYNVPTRRKAFKSASEEHQKIADVMTRYALHNSGKSFTLRKMDQDVSAGVSVRTQLGSTHVTNIGTLFGSNVGKEVIQVDHFDPQLHLKVGSCQSTTYASFVTFTINGYVTNANCSIKRFLFLLFINNRLVECTVLKKALDSLYQTYLPKGGHPFVYLSLEMPANNLDVNVHPTKHEVHFLHEGTVVESVEKQVEAALLSCDSSRTFYMQKLLPTANTETTQKPTTTSKDKVHAQLKICNAHNPQRVYDHQLVRTDSKLQKLDAFLTNTRQEMEKTTTHSVDRENSNDLTPDDPVSHDPKSHDPKSHDSMSQDPKSHDSMSHDPKSHDSMSHDRKSHDPKSHDPMSHDPKSHDSKSHDPKSHDSKSLTAAGLPRRRQIQLTSVLQLSEEVKEKSHKELCKVLHDHTFVGCVEPELALIQHETKLHLVNTGNLSEELFYQTLLKDFGNFAIYRLSESAPIYELAMLGLNLEESGWTPADGSKENLANYIVNFLGGKAEMLNDYFCIDITKEGHISGIPMLLKGYSPPLEGLPLFVMRLATEVDWEEEKACFNSVCREIARFLMRCFKVDSNFRIKTKPKNFPFRFYSLKNNLTNAETFSDVKSVANDNEWLPWKRMVEHTVMKSLRDLKVPTSMVDNGTFLQLANLPDLYKVFERC